MDLRYNEFFQSGKYLTSSRLNYIGQYPYIYCVIEYVTLNRKELSGYISSRAYEKMPVIPISRHRALSHINNPRLSETDILLILAMEDNQLAGYLGILPDFAYTADQTPVKCGWLSCFWVSPLQRGRGIGEQLIRKSLECWNDRIVSADYVPVSKRVYDKTGAFEKPVSKEGIRLYYRMDLFTILPPKNKLFDKLKILLKAFDFAVNIPLDIRLDILNRRLKKVNFQYVKEIDPDTGLFIKSFRENELFRREKTELQWINDFPWILKGDAAPSGQHYHFSSYDKTFDFCNIRLLNNQGQMIAFLVLSKRNSVLKLPYCFAHTDHVPEVVKLIVYHIFKWRISTFVTYRPDIVKFLSGNDAFQIYKKTTVKNYLVTSGMYPLLAGNASKIQDGDGDQAFT